MFVLVRDTFDGGDAVKSVLPADPDPWPELSTPPQPSGRCSLQVPRSVPTGSRHGLAEHFLFVSRERLPTLELLAAPGESAQRIESAEHPWCHHVRSTWRNVGTFRSGNTRTQKSKLVNAPSGSAWTVFRHSWQEELPTPSPLIVAISSKEFALSFRDVAPPSAPLPTPSARARFWHALLRSLPRDNFVTTRETKRTGVGTCELHVSINEIGMDFGSARIECPAKPITRAFTHFANDGETNKFIKSAC